MSKSFKIFLAILALIFIGVSLFILSGKITLIHYWPFFKNQTAEKQIATQPNSSEKNATVSGKFPALSLASTFIFTLELSIIGRVQL